MAYELKEGQGSLFKNSYKQKDSQPDMRGTLLINGVTYEVAGWSRTTQGGDRYLSLKAEPKRDTQTAAQVFPAQPAAPEANDDLPF